MEGLALNINWVLDSPVSTAASPKPGGGDGLKQGMYVLDFLHRPRQEYSSYASEIFQHQDTLSGNHVSHP